METKIDVHEPLIAVSSLLSVLIVVAIVSLFPPAAATAAAVAIAANLLFRYLVWDWIGCDCVGFSGSHISLRCFSLLLSLLSSSSLLLLSLLLFVAYFFLFFLFSFSLSLFFLSFCLFSHSQGALTGRLRERWQQVSCARGGDLLVRGWDPISECGHRGATAAVLRLSQ